MKLAHLKDCKSLRIISKKSDFYCVFKAVQLKTIRRSEETIRRSEETARRSELAKNLLGLIRSHNQEILRIRSG